MGQLMLSHHDIELTLPNLDESFSLQAREEDITLREVSVASRSESQRAVSGDFQTDGFDDFLCHFQGPMTGELQLFQDEMPFIRRPSNYNVDLDEREERMALEELVGHERPLSSQQPPEVPIKDPTVYEPSGIKEHPAVREIEKPDEWQQPSTSMKNEGQSNVAAVAAEESELQASGVAAATTADANIPVDTLDNVQITSSILPNVVGTEAQPAPPDELNQPSSVQNEVTLEPPQVTELSSIHPPVSNVEEIQVSEALTTEAVTVTTQRPIEAVVLSPIHLARGDEEVVTEGVTEPRSAKRPRLEQPNVGEASMPNLSLELTNAPPFTASSAVKQRPQHEGTPPPLQLGSLHLSQEPSSRHPNRRRPRRRGGGALVVDTETQLSKSVMMQNFAEGRDGLRTRAETLAPPASITHPRRARSLNPERLLSLPANFEVAISRKLSALWRAHRLKCELNRGTSGHHQRQQQPQQPNSPVPSSSSKTRRTSRLLQGSSTTSHHALGSIAENSFVEPLSECSREMARRLHSAEASTLSGILEPKQSLSQNIDALMETQMQVASIPEEQMRLSVQEAQETTLVPEVELTAQVDLQPPPMSEIVAPPPPQPTTPFPGIPAFYVNESAFANTVQRVFESGETEVEFSRLLPPTSTRKQAALTFHHLLCVLKKKGARAHQAEPFAPILITPMECP